MSRILDSLTLASGLMLPNRLAKTAMTEGLAENGRPGLELQTVYRRWAASGVGLLISGNVMIDRDHLERPGNVVIDRMPDADMRTRLEQWAEAAKSSGGKVIMQLSHAGRQTPARVNKHPKAPSAVRVDLPGWQFGDPIALTEDEIHAIIDRFGVAATAAREGGFDGVQVHAAHGYLISQFLSPKTNRRNDRWGGSLENRATATALVTSAAYHHTRNPMYLGLVAFLLAWAVYLAVPWTLIGPLAFVLFITRFQIIPEERVLLQKFGDAYKAYQRQVRRWI